MDPFEPFLALEARIKEKADELGLDVVHFSIHPNSPQSPTGENVISVALTLRSEALEHAQGISEQRDVDSMFQEMMGGFNVNEEEDGSVELTTDAEEAEKANEQLQSRADEIKAKLEKKLGRDEEPQQEWEFEPGPDKGFGWEPESGEDTE